jgi:formamidopyrimidine-DNA glycosylase
MPESPDILLMSHYLTEKLIGRNISNLHILNDKFKLNGKDIFGQYTYKIINITSKGKILWFELENKTNNKTIWIITHFGLKGEYSFYNNKTSKIKFIITNDDNDKTYNLYFLDAINYGNISIIDNKNILDKHINELGLDFLQDDYNTDDLKKLINNYLLKHKDAIIGKILISQKKPFLGCGIGNYLLCEILYNAKISPNKKLSQINENYNEIEQLCKSIKYITKLAYYNNPYSYYSFYVSKHKNNIDNNKYKIIHSDIILNKNDVFEYNVYKKKYDNFNNKVLADTTINSNRKTYWVQSVQT